MSHSTVKLSEVARHVVVPADATTTGWPAVQKKARDLGVTFRPWQPGVGKLILSKRSNGLYASTIGGTGLSIPRQVGKTFLVGVIVFCLCLLRPNLTVIWTAHRIDTSDETFKKMQAFARRGRVAPYVKRVVTGSGDEAIEFGNGSRIMFGSRKRGFGRGFDEVDVLIFDEAQILTDNDMDDMIPAANQSRQPTGALLLFMGTPPKPKDPSEVFTRMRTEALAGDDPDTGWVEFGADPDYDPTPLPATLTDEDWKQIAKANPSFPEDTPREAILRMRKKLGPESFIREGCGIWDDPRRRIDVFGRGKWTACRYEGAPPTGLRVTSLAVAATMDLSRCSIVAAGVDPDEDDDPDQLVHVKPLQHGPGSWWVVERALELQQLYDVDVVVDGRGPGAALIPKLEAAGVRVRTATTGEVLDACADVHTLVREQRLRHGDFEELNEAVRGAVKRTVGDRWAWGRKVSTADISPLEAGTLAVWATTTPAPPPTKSKYETAGVATI